MKKRLIIFSTFLFVFSMQVFAQTKEELEITSKEEIAQIRIDLEEKENIIVDEYLLKIKEMDPLDRPSKKEIQKRIDFIQEGFNNLNEAEKLLSEIIKIEDVKDFNAKWKTYELLIFNIKMFYTRTLHDWNNIKPNTYVLELIERLK